MSRYLSKKFERLIPYTPGEQPRDMKYIKLNTNESPFPTSQAAALAAACEAKNCRLYPDPDVTDLACKFSEVFGIEKDQVVFSNGSDDLLNFAFMAFCDEENPAAFPDITYGFYSVFAEVNRVPFKEIPLKEDFSIDINDYIGIRKTIFIANPNAPTGIAIEPSVIEKVVRSNPDNVIIIDEAYVDFGAKSCISLINKYDNLLVIGTFSKSRSLAGARLGYAIGCRELINDLNTIRFSTNPYNINRMTMAAGIGALLDEQYTKDNCQKIIENRKWTTREIEKMGFTHTPSKANFIFAKKEGIDGERLYLELKKRGVLVRHFNQQRIKDYLRITVGTREDMENLISKLKEMFKEV